MMLPPTKKFWPFLLRLLVAVALLAQLYYFRAWRFSWFYPFLPVAVLAGAWLRRRRAGLLIDGLLTYAAIFLLPPGLLCLLASFWWSFIALVSTSLTGFFSYRAAHRRLPALLAALWVLSLVGSLAAIGTLSSTKKQSPSTWAGTPIEVDDAGWDQAQPTHVVAAFPVRHKIGDQVEPVMHGEPPPETALGALVKDEHRFAVRAFKQTAWVELMSSTFDLPGCAPLMDMAFYRYRKQWFFLCGGNESLVVYDWDKPVEAGRFAQLGLWPRHLAIHQDLERLYLIDPSYGRLLEIDLEAGEILRMPHVGFGATDVTVSADGRLLFVALPYHGRLLVLDVPTLKIVKKISVPLGTAYLATDTRRRRLYAATLPTGKLIALDATEHTIVARGRLHSPVLDLAFDGRRQRLYWSTPAGFRWIALDEAFTE